MPSRRLPCTIRPKLLILSSLILSLCTPLYAQDEVSEAAPTRLKIANIEDEPKVEIRELKAASPFKLVSRTRRADSNDKLIQLCQETVDVTSRRLLSTDLHTPWQMMHGLLGLRQDFVMMHQGGQVSGLEWIKEGQTFENEHWFEKTRHGGRAHPYSRPYAFEGHANQCVAILSMCGVDLDQQFGTATGPITMRDMIKHAQMTVSEKDEPTWTLWALSRYLPPNAQWQNEKGEFWSIEKLVQQQTAKPMMGAPCGGTHSLFALAHARNVYLRQGKPLRGVWLQAEYKIRQHINTARMQTNSDGSLSSNYFRGRHYDPDFNKRMASVGHVLEFLMIALPQEELNSRWVRQAIETVARDLMNNRKAYVKCSPLYHTVNALNIYLDRVNPRVPVEVAVGEETRTAAANPATADERKLATNGVPATSISQSRDLPAVSDAPSAKVEETKTAETKTAETKTAEAAPLETKSVEAEKTKVDAPAATLPPVQMPEAEKKPIEPAPVPVDESSGEEGKTLEPVPAPPEPEMLKVVPETEVPRVVPEAEPPVAPISPVVEPDAQPEPVTLKQVPLLPLIPKAVTVTNKDGEWKSTRTERRTALVVPEEKTGGRSLLDPSSLPAVAKPINDMSNGEVSEVNELRPVTTSELEPAVDSQVRIEPLMDADAALKAQQSVQRSDSKPVAVAPVSQPRLLSDVASASPQEATPAAKNSATVPAEINKDFLSGDLDPKVWASRFEVESREIFASRGEIIEALKIKDGATIADIGAGTGLFLEPFASAVGASGRVFAIDISPRFVEYLDKRVEAEKLDNVSVVRNDETSLQLLMHRIDVAFVCDTYHHFEHHEEMLTSIFESLLPGGELVLIDFEKIPGQSRDWVMNHVRADKATFRSEVTAAGFQFVEEVKIPGFKENYFLRFRRPKL